MAQEDNAVNSRRGASDSRKGERTEATCTSHSKLPHPPPSAPVGGVGVGVQSAGAGWKADPDPQE